MSPLNQRQPKEIRMNTTSIRAKAAAQALRTVSALALLAAVTSCGQPPDETSAPQAPAGNTASNPAPAAGPQAPPASDPMATLAAAAEESLGAPASVLAVAGAQSAQDRVTPLVSAVRGAKTIFVDCPDQGPCVARVEARSLASLRTLLQSMSDAFSGIGFVVRERLDAYTGKWYQSDVTLGGDSTAAVPADESELLVNFGDPPDAP
jgi:hypothetical protein